MISHFKMATGDITCCNNSMNSDESRSCSEELCESTDDSVIDKDYVPMEDVESTESSEEDAVVTSSKLTRTTDRSPERTPRSRWRQRRDNNYERVKRKRRRNLGQEYVTAKTKKTVKARELGSPCSCKRQCRNKLNNTHEKIFTKFWDLGSYDLQNSYLFGCIRVAKKKRSYKKKQKRQESSRKFTAQYSVNVDGQDVEVCKVEFMHVHGLQNSQGRVNHIVNMKTKGAVVPEKDSRGKHTNRPNTLSSEQKQFVRTHIDMIPKYQSHYSRGNNLGRTYLNCDMTIASLYREYYVPWCQQQSIVPVKESAYRKIFCTECNIAFKLPKSDTCKTCDETNIKLDAARLNADDQEMQRLTISINLHKSRAKAMQDLLKAETERSKINKNTCVISFDLQQAMPIPKLTTGPAFYCRKVWLYNLGVHDCTAGQGYMYVWTENQAKRGADEIASVLLKFLSTKTNVDDLVIFTDNCPGQNKNWLLMAFWLQLVKEKKFKTITHHFLISGHTHLPSDRDFALIEKRHRRYAPEIYSPEGWHKIIKDANSKTPFVVTVMTQEDFFSFEPIMAGIHKNLRTTDKQNVDFSGVYTFHFKAENPKSFFIKHTVHGEYNEVNILKKGRPLYTFLNKLQKKYIEQLKIPAKKIRNVRSLLPYIPPIYHSFYNGLASMDKENEADDVEIIE